MVEASSGRRVCFAGSFLLPVSLAWRWPPRLETFEKSSPRRRGPPPSSDIFLSFLSPSSLRMSRSSARTVTVWTGLKTFSVHPFVFLSVFSFEWGCQPCQGFGIGPRRLVPPLFPVRSVVTTKKVHSATCSLSQFCSSNRSHFCILFSVANLFIPRNYGCFRNRKTEIFPIHMSAIPIHLQ